MNQPALLAFDGGGGALRAPRYQPYPAYRDSGVDWLGQLPSHWPVKRLKHLCRRSALYGANEPATTYVDEGVRFLRTTDITENGDLIDHGVYLEPTTVKEYMLTDGDLLLSRSGTIGRAFLYEGSRHGPCAYAGYLVRFVPSPRLWPRFAFYFTKSNCFAQWLSLSVIASTIGNVNGQKYANIPLPCPPPDEQRAAAAFLDRETGRIDALIAKKERLIELLAEKRTALISHAVTKGLNPAAPMKPSGISWLGRVPEHWTTDRLRWTITGCQNGIWGDEPDGVNDIICVRVADFDRTAFRATIDNPTIRAVTASERRRRVLRRGDLLLEKSGGGELQPVGAVVGFDHDAPAVCSNFVARVLVARGFDPRFLVYLHAHLYWGRINTRSIKQTTGIQNLDSAAYFDERACWPPLPEQRVITGFLDRETGRIDTLIAAIESAIGQLREYRSALISAAVTGKIDVREETAV